MFQNQMIIQDERFNIFDGRERMAPNPHEDIINISFGRESPDSERSDHLTEADANIASFAFESNLRGAKHSETRALQSESCPTGWGTVQIAVSVVLGVVALLSISISLFVHRTRKHRGEAKVLKLANRNRELEAYIEPHESHIELIKSEMADLHPDEQELLRSIEIDGSRLEVGGIIGLGSFAEVRKGTYRGTPVAVKTLKTVDKRALTRFKAEILLMKELRHPNIVMLIGASWSSGRLMMVVELFERGNLADVLDTTQLTWREKFHMLEDIGRGMAYLHSAKYFDEATKNYRTCVIHRDLKPQNMLVTSNLRVKITDFGEARAIDSNFTMTQVGTLLYIAPEIVRGDKYDEKCDIYSFSVVLLSLLQMKKNIFDIFAQALRDHNGITLSSNSSSPEVGLIGDGGGRQSRITPHMVTVAIVNENLRPKLPVGVPPSLSLLIEQSWDPEPTNRPSFKEILEFIDTIVKEEIGNVNSFFPFVPEQKKNSKSPSLADPEEFVERVECFSAFSETSYDDLGSIESRIHSPGACTLSQSESDALASKILARVKGITDPLEYEIQELVERRRVKEKHELIALNEDTASRKLRQEIASTDQRNSRLYSRMESITRRPQGYRPVYGALTLDNLAAKNPLIRKQLSRQREQDTLCDDEKELLTSRCRPDAQLEEGNTFQRGRQLKFNEDERALSCLMNSTSTSGWHLDRIGQSHANSNVSSVWSSSPYPDSPLLLQTRSSRSEPTNISLNSIGVTSSGPVSMKLFSFQDGSISASQSSVPRRTQWRSDSFSRLYEVPTVSLRNQKRRKSEIISTSLKQQRTSIDAYSENLSLPHSSQQQHNESPPKIYGDNQKSPQEVEFADDCDDDSLYNRRLAELINMQKLK